MSRGRNNKQIDWIQQKLSRSYYFLVILFTIVGIAALDLAASVRNENSTPKPSQTTPAQAMMTAQAILQQPAWNYFHPVWKKEDTWSFFTSEPNVTIQPQVDVSEIVLDPEKRVEPEFQVSSSMRKRVEFWMEVYAKYSKRLKVVHDRNDPAIIYGYIDLRPLYRVLGNSPTVESRANEIERKILKEFKGRLLEAIGDKKPTLSSASEKEEIRLFLSQSGALSVPATMKLIESVRSQTGQRDEFLKALFRSATLLPHIETVFKRKGLPAGLARIPFVESSFNVKALSNVGAVGIWQFMPETAKQMISSEEERHWSDPLKQTASAAKLFQIYRSLVPDWGCAITSYNSGVGRIQRMVKKYRVKTVDGIVALPNSAGLGFAGQNFYAEFLAVNLVEAYKDRLFTETIPAADVNLVLKGIKPFPKGQCEM